MEKGSFGYLNRHKRNLLISISILGIVIIAGVVFSLIVFDTRKSLAILLPILTALPFAKQLVLYILCANFKPVTKDEKTEIDNKILYKDKSSITYDISISRYEGIIYFPVGIIRDGRILLLYNSKNNKKVPNKDAAKKEVINIFANEKNPYVIIVVDKLDDFVKKANAIKEPQDDFVSRDKKVRDKLLELGI